MSEPIYVLIIGKGYTEAWYRLTDEEQAELWSKVMELDALAGAEWHIVCDSRWADEDVYHWAVVEYPDLKGYQERVKKLESLEWWRYFSAKTILGTKIEM